MSNKTEGTCAVCDKPATTRCGNCKLAFYCDKEHQRKHWPNHKSNCLTYEIHENEKLGRHLIASRDLNTGDLVLSETPLVWGPAAHSEERICVGCGIKDALCRCPNCAWPACMVSCTGLVDEHRHAQECNLLAAARLLPR